MSSTADPGNISLPSLSSSAELMAENDSRAGLRISIFAHGGLAAAFLIKCLVFPGQPTLYVPSLRVDLVGLPDVLKKDLSRIPKTPGSEKINDLLKKAAEEAKNIKESPPKAAPEEPATDEMVLKPKTVAPHPDREKKLKSALDRIKALTRVQNETDQAERHESMLVKGNRVSPGTSLSGDAKETAEAGYLDLLRDRLQENWELPVWISRQNLSAQVWVYIDARGRVRGVRFEKTSGNTQFDEAVKKAVQDSQPFPAPPSGIASAVLGDGILVGFPL